MKRTASSQLMATTNYQRPQLGGEVLEQRDLMSAVAFISEVNPSGSGSSYAADWFEVTNTGTTALDITGWKVDDSTNAFATAVALRGLTNIPAGKSAVFFEGNATGSTDATITANFSTAWFGSSTLPDGFLIGAYGGSGIGLSGSGDAVNLFDASGTAITGVSFGAATVGKTFDNTAQGSTVTTLSTAGTNGAFLASGGTETGSPGTRLNAKPLTAVDLSIYVRVGRFDLPEPTRTTAPANSVLAQEVSAVTYNKDTDTLFVVGDGGTSIVQVSKTGALIDSMTLATGDSPQGTEFYDTEGLTYVGNGQFVMVEERDRKANLFTYVPGTTLGLADVQTVTLGTAIGNVGIEGMSFDPTTSGYIAVKESSPLGVFQTGIDFVAGTATNGSAATVNSTNLFDPTLAGLLDFADVFPLSNLSTLTGDDADNLLILSQESGKIVNIDRSGTISNSLSFTVDAGNPLSIADHQHEGLTMDGNGVLYVVSENGGGDFDHPQLWVYEPSSVPNAAPTALALTNQVNTLDENTNTFARVRVATIAITDDAIGTNNLTVTGADASFFEVVTDGLFIKAGTTLDFETKSSYSVTVEVDDPSLGSTPDASATYSLTLNDIANENPSSPTLIISEFAPWGSGSSFGSDWFEVSNTGTTAIDITGWKIDDSSASFNLGAALSGITSIAAGESVIFIETADLAGKTTAFVNNWFGGTAPAGLHFGNYTVGGVGLSTTGDAINLFDAAGVVQANVTFGASPAGPTFATFNNAAGVNNAAVSTLSAVNVNGGFVAAANANEIGSPGTIGKLFISEVAPWSSSGSPVAADWFEVTNTTAHAVDLSGWTIDDSSGSFVASLALNGITSIASGESVIFLETADLAGKSATFNSNWFGSNVSANLQIGNYTGAGVGLSSSGDAVHLYNATGVLQTSVTFGASSASPFATFDNTAAFSGATISQLSSVGVNGAFVAKNSSVETGSPGRFFNRAAVITSGATASATEANTNGITGPSTSTTPYLTSTNSDVQFTSILTVGDAISGYRMVGIPDGMGAFDNGDGTFTLLLNHELNNTVGIARAHGQKGSFVSRWVIDSTTLQVVSIQDFLQDGTSVFLSNNDQTNGTVHSAYLAAATTIISRLCSADLAAPSAYFFNDGTTSYGTTARIFQSGEESGGSVTGVGPETTTLFGRQFAFIATDDLNTVGVNEANTAYELPHAGLFAWENNLANPLAQRKTIVMGMDDGSPIGQIYMWVGEKQTTGNVVERAGLTKQSANDNMYVLRVPSLATVDGSGVPIETLSAPVSGAFTMVNEGDVSGLTFAGFEALSDASGATQFLRPEDGQWDPSNPSDFYFLTTSNYDQVKDGVGSTVGRSRLYKLSFTDIANPEAGGTITCLLDGTEAGNMFDNMTVTANGKAILQEDVGNQQHLGKVWSYDIATDTLTELGQHDRARFGDVGVAQAAPFSQDEESSGVIDMSEILGAGTYLVNVQAHYNIGDTELVEGGQLLLMRTNVTSGTQLVATVTATDADADTLTYSISGGADAADFVIDSTTGKLSFAVAPNFESPADADTNNVYVVNVSVSDGTNATTQTLSVTVTNANESPSNTTVSSVSVAENTTAVTTATGTDAEIATLTFAISGGADANKFAINSSSGALTFVTAPNFEAPTDNGSNNSYFVTVTVSDGVNAPVNKTVAVSVTNANDSPVSTTSASASVAENSTAVATVTATDLENDVLAFSIGGGADARLFSVNSATGALTFVSAPNFEFAIDAGGNNVYDVTVSISDGVSAAVNQAIAVTVTNVGEAPTATNALQIAPIGSYATGTSGVAEIVAHDPVNQLLFSLNGTNNRLDVIDLSDPTNPTLSSTISLSAYGALPNSVAVKNGIVAVAMEANPKTDNGKVVFFTTAGAFQSEVTVGAQPDMLTFTPNGLKVLVANEGEPNVGDTINPAGSISIISLAGGVGSPSVTTASFTGFDGLEDKLRGQGVRISAGKSFSVDAEPEFIAVSADGTTARVTLQENNAFAVLNLSTDTITSIQALGLKDFSTGTPQLTNYDFDQSTLPVIGTTATNQDIKLGGFSGLHFEGVDPVTGKLKFITNTDRGPNGEPSDVNATNPGIERPFIFPTFTPEVVRFELDQATGSITITERIQLKKADGTTLLSGLPNVQATPFVDEVGVDLNGNLLTNDPLGADLEGIVIAADGSFWMPDEYRPAIYHFSAAGVLLDRFVPQGTAAAAGQAAGTFGTEVLPSVYGQFRRANRGFEAIAIEGTKIYAFIQTNLDNPGTSVRNNGVIRILELETTNNTVTGEYVYVMRDTTASGTSKTDKIGDAVSLGGGRFLVLERDDRTTTDANKLVYEINLAGATNVTGTAIATATSGTTLESLTPAGLTTNSIRPVDKRLVLNAAVLGYTGVSKPEGLALVDGDTIALLNDNDFQIAGTIAGNGSAPLNPSPEPIRLGVINFSGSNGLDASDRDLTSSTGKISINRQPVFGMFMPDGVASFSANGATYFITANEGDDRNDFIEPDEVVRVSTLTLDATAFPNGATLKTNSVLGRLNASKNDGDLDADGDIDRIQTLGGRSFTIWDASGNRVFDSGDALEQITAALVPSLFNSDGAAASFDSRSDNKGPEAEGVTTGVIDGRTYAFIGLERVGGFMTFDVTDPLHPQFVTYTNPAANAVGTPGQTDVSPEGILFIPAASSPNGHNLIVTANEVSGSTTVYSINRAPVITSGATASATEANTNGITGTQSSDSPFLTSSNPNVQFTSILSVGDAVGGYRMVGLPDGMGAFDNGDGTFTLLVNHEINNTLGIARAHGQKGAFVSRWVIDSTTLQVVSIQDFLADGTSVFLSNNDQTNGTVHSGYLAAATTIISRLCSADLAAPSAYFFNDGTTSYGTTARIFQTGEESSGTTTGVGPEATTLFGRQFAFIATDDPNTVGVNEANTAYELPHAGLFSWENNLANPLAQRKTIVMGMDDGSPTGQVYVWVGEKQTTGNVVERAGLTKQSANDNLYVIKVAGLTPDGTGATNEDRTTALNGTFTLENEGDVSGLTFAQLETLSDTSGGTQFFRPEDGQWDPSNPSDFYFVTTDRFDQVKDGLGTQIARSRLYKLSFTDIANPELGGTITALLDGTEAGNMFDNMTVTANGKVILQEDPGNQPHSAKIWEYDIATDALTLLAQHDRARFGDAGLAATAPFNQDEETSGVIDMSAILGAGTFLVNVQAHYNIGDTELVEDGQLLLMRTNVTTGTQLVTTITATDADADTLTYSISGGADAADFVIDATTGKLSFAVAPNFESPADADTNNVYLVEVSVNDGTNPAVKQTITVTVTNANEPPSNTTVSSVSVAENTTAVTTATGTDAENAALTFAISGGADANKFAINASSGALTFVSAPNFEAPTDNGSNNSYFVTVTVSDGVNAPVNKTVIVSVTNIDDVAPMITSGATAAAIAENSGAGQVIYTVTSTDTTDYVSGSTTYSLKSVNDFSSFSINGSTGAVTLTGNPNNETKPSYSFTVIATDAPGNHNEQAVSLAINNVNEAPLFTQASYSFGPVIQATVNDGDEVGLVSATDPDASDTISYSITAGNTDAAFDIDDSGNITVLDATKLTNPSFSLTVTATDSLGLTDTTSVSISVTVANRVPTISAQSFGINSASIINTVVGQVVASDSDSGQTLAYTISAGGDPSGAFAISSSGVLTVADATKLATRARRHTATTVSVTVTDNGTPTSLSSNAIMTIGLSDRTRQAPNVADKSFTLAENNRNKAIVGTFLATASYRGQRFFYSLAGTDAESFTIDSANGTVALANGVSFNFETKSSYSFQIIAADSADHSKTATANATLNVKNVNEAPTLSLSVGTLASATLTSPLAGGRATITIDESTAEHPLQTGDVIATLTASDQDQAANTLNYLKNGAANVVFDATGAFSYDSATGQIKVANASKISFETRRTIPLSFAVTDDRIAGDSASRALTTAAAITLALNDLNEPPSITSASSFTIAENNLAGTTVGTVVANDGDSKRQKLNYSIVSVRDAANAEVTGQFTIDSVRGTLKAQPLDHETNASYTIVVRVTDNGNDHLLTGNLHTDQSLAINVKDVNESAMFTLKDADESATVSSLSVSKTGLQVGTVIGHLLISDPDSGLAGGTSSVTVADSSRGGLTYNSATGEIQVSDLTKLKVGTRYILRFTVRDDLLTPLSSTVAYSVFISR